MARYDVHRHLEGSHTPRALATLAKRHEVTAFAAPGGGYLNEAQIAARTSLNGGGDWIGFYDAISYARRIYSSPEAIRDATILACEDAATECDGFELRFSLFSMTRELLKNRGSDLATVSDDDFRYTARSVLDAILDARARATQALRKPILLRAGWTRTYEAPAKFAVAAEIVKLYAEEFCGLDILGKGTSSPEALPAGLVELVNELRRKIPDLSLHAGELDGANAVADALALAPNAIGHGIRSLEDPAVIAQLKAANVTLEHCPTSNALLVHGAVAALAKRHGVHPLVALQQQGVRCALATDDPMVFGTCFQHEWYAAERHGADLVQLERDGEARWAALAKR